MDLRHVALLGLLSLATLSGCLGNDTDDTDTGDISGDETPVVMEGLFELITLPAEFGDTPLPTTPRELQGEDIIGLYEPTIDVGPEGNLYVSAHSADVGFLPAPAFYSVDDGVTWAAMGNLGGTQGGPETSSSAPMFSDEVFIVAGAEGQAWGMDCCTNEMANPLVGWGSDGAEVLYYNQNAQDTSRFAIDPVLNAGECIPAPGADRPWLAYANGKLLMVNNPGLSVMAGGEALGGIALQVGAMDVPPLVPIAYSGAAWQISWNLCGSTGGFIPGIPDMRDDHFFAVPQWIDYDENACGAESHYDVITGNAADVYTTTQTTAFYNSHVRPSETDGGPSEIGLYGQTVFDADGRLYVGAMNNTAVIDDDGACVAGEGGIHFALSTDDAATFTETTFRFDRPVSGFYMDGNRYGEGFLLNWGEIDGNNTDWFMAHVFANDDGTLRLENIMLVMDDGPEASRHVQGAALGPDGRAYAILSWNSQNPNGGTVEVGDTPLFVAVQQDGPVMPVA